MQHSFLKKISKTVLAVAFPVFVLSGQAVQASTYPTYTIKIVVPYNAGGGTDVLSRAVAAGVSNHLGKAVIVENRPGASGMIGSDVVSRSKPDGYTLVMTAADTHTINPHVYPNISYNAQEDFVGVSQVGDLPYALVVSPGLGVENIAEYIALAKEKPGDLTYASWGIGSSSHVAMEMLNLGEGLDVLHVPFTGASPAITAVMGGQVDALFVPLALAKPNHDAGKVRLLGLAASQPFEAMPDVPTLVEQGVEVVAAPWVGILAPAGTPPEVLDILSDAVDAAVKTDDVISALTVAGLQINVRNSEDFNTYLADDYDLWGATVKGANIKAE